MPTPSNYLKRIFLYVYKKGMAVDHGKIQADYLDFMKVVRLSKASKGGKASNASNASNATVYVNGTPFPKDYNIMTVGQVEEWRQKVGADFWRG